MSDTGLPISFGQFLIMSVFPGLVEQNVFGKPSVRLGKVLTLSVWLYETGAILGRFWKDRVPVLVCMYEVEHRREEFAQYWRDQARKRLEKYAEQPRAFQMFVLQTDLDMLMGKRLEDLEWEGFVKIAAQKLSHDDANRWLRLIETSLIEGIMFGSLYPKLTHDMLVNAYERIDVDSWKEARRYGVALSEERPQTTAAEKEKEAVDMARDYVMQYHPGLMTDLF